MFSVFYNATLERFFSHMGVVKTDWQNRLNEQSLENNLRIHVAGPDLTKFSETYVAKAVAAWYNDKPRRMHQKKRERSTNKKRLLPRNQMLILVWTFLMSVSVTKLVVKLLAVN